MISLVVLFLMPFTSAQEVTEVPTGYGVPANFTIPPEWEKLFAAGKNLTVFYKNPGCGYGPGHELIRTAIIYLEQIEELEKAVDVNRPTALEALWAIYINGGPLHLRQIPYGEFIRIFNWVAEDVDEYSTVIDDTKRIWGRLLEELQRIAPDNFII